MVLTTNGGSAQTRQIPMSVSVNQNGRDTLIQATSTITTYSDSETAAAMKDTAYLRNLSGDYWIGNVAGKVITIEVSEAKKLLITLPNQGQHELVPIIPIYFTLKDLPMVEILIFTDRFKQVRGLNVIDKRKPKSSSERQIDANKQGKFRE